MRNIQNTNFNQLNGILLMKHVTKSSLNIPFCCLKPWPLVRPIWRWMFNHLKTSLLMDTVKATRYSVFPPWMTKGEWSQSHKTLMIYGMSGGKYVIIQLSCVWNVMMSWMHFKENCFTCAKTIIGWVFGGVIWIFVIAITHGGTTWLSAYSWI